MCPSPSFCLLAAWSLSVFQQCTYIQFQNTFHPAICTSYWPICLPSFNSQKVTFALILAPFLGFNMITEISAFSTENPFSEASSSLSRLSPGSSLFPPQHIFFPSLLLPGELVTHLPALGLIFVLSLNAPFIPGLQEFHMTVSLDALIYLVPVLYHVLWLFILAVKDPCQFTPALFFYPLLPTSSHYRERSYAPSA